MFGVFSVEMQPFEIETPDRERYTHLMKVMTDEGRRVTLPASVQAGDMFELEVEANGRVVLTKLAESDRPRARLVRREGHLLLSSEATITWEQTRKALDEFP